MKIEPESGLHISLLAVVREILEHTRRTKEIAALPAMGLKLLGIESGGGHRQITLVDNRMLPNKSYTALIPDDLSRRLIQHVMVKAGLRGCAVGNHAFWIVADIDLL